MVYVLADSSVEISKELISTAAVLGEVTVVDILGTQVNYGELGAHTVIRVDAPGRIIFPAVEALSSLAAGQAAPIIIAAGPTGNEIAARIAVRLGSGILTDISAINPDGTAIQSIFGDTTTVTSAVGGSSPVYTVRPGSHGPELAARQAQELVLAAQEPSAIEPTVLSFSPAEHSDRPDLATAKVVIAGGRGVGGAEGFENLVEPLADLLGAAVGVTRDVVDEGHYDGQYQIGQTGVTISPDVYIGLGISGAIQHKSGMQTSKKIIAINSDEDAPIFEIADLGIVAKLEDIIPPVIEALKNK